MSDFIPKARVDVQLEGLKVAIMQCLSRSNDAINAMIEAKVDAMINEKAIERILNKEVARVIKIALEEEVTRFYRHGDGRIALREAVSKALGGEKA